MNTRYYRFLFTAAVVATLLGLVIFGNLFPSPQKAYRDWTVRQTRPIAGDIQMRIEGTYILPDDKHPMFRIWSRWLGDDPTNYFNIRATLRTTAEFQDTPPMPYWYVPLERPKPWTKESPLFLWEFHAPQGAPEHLWLRVYFQRKNSLPNTFRSKDATAPERWVDFDFPYHQSSDPTAPGTPIQGRLL